MAFPPDPRHAKARQEFLRQAQIGATFTHSAYPSSHFEVLPSGKLHEMNTQREMGSVQSMAPFLETGQVSFTRQAPGVLSESEYAAAQSAHSKVAAMSGDEIRANLAGSSPQTIEHIIPGNLASTAEATHEPMTPETKAAKEHLEQQLSRAPSPEEVRLHTLAGMPEREKGTAKDDSDVTSPDSSLEAAPADWAKDFAPQSAPADWAKDFAPNGPNWVPGAGTTGPAGAVPDEAPPESPPVTPTPKPGPQSGPTGPGGGSGANGWADIVGGLGWVFGAAAGGPMGGAVGQLAGRMAGTVIGGGKVKGGDVLKSVGALAGGAIAGKAGSMIGSALGGMFGGDQQPAGQGGDVGAGSGGGAVTVPGGGPSGEEEMVRLLREMSMNIKVLVNDGLYVKGNHSRQGGTI